MLDVRGVVSLNNFAVRDHPPGEPGSIDVNRQADSITDTILRRAIFAAVVGISGD